MERTGDRVELAADLASGVALEHGLQIVAPAGGEPTVLALAAQLEQLRP